MSLKGDYESRQYKVITNVQILCIIIIILLFLTPIQKCLVFIHLDL